MVDLGAQLSSPPGANAKNAYLYNYSEDGLDALSQVIRGEMTVASTALTDDWPETLDPISQPRVPPVEYPMNGANPEQAIWDNAPAVASSFNVGGMGTHWTCCTPRPSDAERVPFFDPNLWEDLVSAAEDLLRTTQEAFTGSLRGQVVREALAAAFDDRLPPERKVQMLPLACERQSERWVQWTGADTVLGPLAEPGTIPNDRFELRAETICRRLTVEGGRISGAELEHLPTGSRSRVSARTYVVAANTIYTPQLLWASGIRPLALGRYFNDQPLMFTQIVLGQPLLARIAERWDPPPPDVDPIPIPRDDPIPNVWIPFSDPEHPFHCQIHREAFPYSVLPEDLGVDRRAILDLRWFCRKHVRREDRVAFSDRYVDLFGMPQPTFHYTFSDEDRRTVNAAFDDLQRAASLLGGYLPSREPHVSPRGTSIHYQGTTRMGESNDEQSVCDAHSKVWDVDNLYVGGNSVIPTSTACNPTLTSVALALHSCEAIGASMTS